MAMTNNVEVVKNVIELLDWYLNRDICPEYEAAYGERVDPEYFLMKVVEQWPFDESNMESIAELFFKVLKYEKFLSILLKNTQFSNEGHDYCLYLVFLYYALFELNEETLATIQRIMMFVNIKKALALATYIIKPKFISSLFKSAVQIWDDEYVKSELLASANEKNFQALYDGLEGRMTEIRKARKKELTKPIDMQVLKRSQRPKPIVEYSLQGEVEEPSVVIKATRIPKTTYKPQSYEKKFEETRKKNREKAMELYEEAQKNAFRASIIQPKVPVVENYKKTQIRRRKTPVIKEPEIQPKTTATVILRDGARLMKIEQDEIRRLEEIMKGGCSSKSLKVLEKDIQEERAQKQLEDIEKKHLQGLLTYEESLIAKQKYLKRMKEGAEEFRKEKEMWMKQLEEWRAEEQIRIRENVEKGKSYEKGGREAMMLIKEEKHRMAMETMEESRNLKERWLAEKEEELKRKIQMIKEIKALQAFGAIRRREATANATASIGLLCEMSTEELKQRLLILQLEVQEEIERKREEFRLRKECRRAIIDGYKDLIQQHHVIRKEQQRIEKSEKKPIKPSLSVEALKKKLEEKRKERLQQ